MSLAWTRKYRPTSFDDYLGDNVKQLVMNRFSDPINYPQTIFLYGTRGTGKTSMARLMCKELLCQSKVDGRACGECDSCKEITEYITSTEAGVDCEGIIEIDAATTTGKNDINDIIEDALIAPLYSRYKVLILDEVHMLSKSAQNSLLKVLEEPPKHLVFILCTTDPEGVLATIHSRMQANIEVKKKSVDEMAEHLLGIAKKEGLKTSVEALKIIAKKADRVPREAINLLETIAKNFANVVTLESVRQCTGDVSTEIYMEYYQASNKGLEEILEFNKKLKEKDISIKNFMSGFIRFTLDCLYVRHGINLDEYPKEYLELVQQVFGMYTSLEFDALLQVIEQSARTLGTDDSKNELIMTTTAMRIGKIGLLAQGLSSEQARAEKENKQSVMEYQKRNTIEVSDQIAKERTQSPTKEVFAEVLKQMTDVPTVNGIRPIIVEEEQIEEKQEGVYSIADLEKLI